MYEKMTMSDDDYDDIVRNIKERWRVREREEFATIFVGETHNFKYL